MSRRRAAERPRADLARATDEVEALLRAGRWEDAKERAEALVAGAPNEAVAHSLLSRALFYANQSSRATQHAERAAELAPEDASMLARLGGVYVATGRLDAAIERCRAALAIDRSEPSAAMNLALALAKSGRQHESVEALRALSARASMSSALRSSALELLAELADHPASRSLREAIEKVAIEDATLSAGASPAVLAAAQRGPAALDSVADRVGRDLCALARAGRIERATGRDAELEQLIEVLCRKRKSNPCLVGPAGVGKTAIVEALAHRINEGAVPPALRGARIVELSMASLTAGTSLRGELEARLQQLIEELRSQRSTILFIDEVHTLVASGGQGQIGVAEVLKPAMARGELSLIGATTDEGYERSIQRDPALARRFERITVREPDEQTLRSILRGAATELGRHHGVAVDDGTITLVCELAARWLTDRRMPDVGVDVLDRACVRAARMASATVTSEHVVETVASIARTSVEQLRLAPGATLERAITALGSAVLGHESARRSLATAVALASVRDARRARPRATLLLQGPPSVGKHTALRALAAALDRPIVQFDLSTVAERHDLARLLGTSAGFVGYDDGSPLLRSLRAQPNAILCFDNAEQAHPDARAIIAAAVREGQFVDARGDSADLRRAIVAFVSQRNEAARARAGFSVSGPEADALSESSALGAALAATLDATIQFGPLELHDRAQLARRFIDESRRALREHGIDLELTDEALEWLARKSASARELRARCERDVVALALYKSAVPPASLRVDVADGALRCESR
jgi:ATP-dependent Clp protease ATP-binding subunit ClpA